MYATALNYTVYSDTMSDRGFSCWWQITVNDTLWDTEQSTINLYLHRVQNMTLYLFSGTSRESLLSSQSLTNINSTSLITNPASTSIYLAAVPVSGK